MFLDIAVGIFLAVIGGSFFQQELTPFFVLACVFFALSPDIDVVIYLFRNKLRIDEKAHSHRDLLHYPLFFIPIGMVIALPFGWEWSVLFALGALWHFLHDTLATGWGIRWFWPISKNHYIFFRKSLSIEKPGLPFRFLYVWTQTEVKDLMVRYGEPDWFKNFYFSPHPLLIAELGALAIAVATLLFVK